MFFGSRLKILLIPVLSVIISLVLFGLVSSSASERDGSALLTLSGSTLAPERPPLEAPKTKKFAVLIGIVYENYDLGTINFADQDALSMYRLLTERWGFPPENVVMLRNGEATLENITKAVDWLTQNPDVDSQSDVVFYYSGHGLRNAAGIGLNIPEISAGYSLVPHDYEKRDYRKGDGLIWDSYLAARLGRINPERMWITIDSCSSGGFARPGITGPNRVVTLSSQHDELSGEINETQRGVFTQYMIEDGIARGLAVEPAFAGSTARAYENYGQNPQIADEYPGNLDFSVSSDRD